MLKLETELPERTYITLVSEVFDALPPTTIMTVSFAIVGLLVLSENQDPLLIGVSLLGLITALGRIAILLHYRRDARDPALTFTRARRMELHFSLSHYGFAACFGAFSAAAYTSAGVDVQAVLVALIFGYGAGVTVGLAVRPLISIPSVAVATVPMIVATVCGLHLTGVTLGFLLTVFLTGGVHAIIGRYRLVSARITTIGTSASLARIDPLTGLGNRLALREAFEGHASALRDESVAVLCLDLDRFKAVNDTYGHPVGDALLAVVAARLRDTLRKGDFAGRLGGDEFVVVQTQVRHPSDVEMLARRIARDVAEPYMTNGREISVGTSIGYALSGRDSNFDDLAACADQALYWAKREGSVVASHEMTAAGSCGIQQLGVAASH